MLVNAVFDDEIVFQHDVAWVLQTSWACSKVIPECFLELAEFLARILFSSRVRRAAELKIAAFTVALKKFSVEDLAKEYNLKQAKEYEESIARWTQFLAPEGAL